MTKKEYTFENYDVTIYNRYAYTSAAEFIKGEYVHQAIAPIICEGDMIGCVILLENDNKSKMGEVEQKLAQSAAGFLGRQMEQ